MVVTLLLEVTDHVEGDLFYFKDGGGGRMGRGCFGSKETSHSIKSKICTSILGVRVPRIQIDMVRVSHIQIGREIDDNLAHKLAMHLANVQTLGSQCLASKQSKTEIWLRRSQIYLCVQIEK
jgi:hypothetical protein